MIGLGLDIVDIERFASQLADRASGWAATVFTAAEQRGASVAAGGRDLHLASRFAAKEAFVKAWSSARRGQAPALATIDLRQIEVIADGFGRPAVRLSGDVAAAVLATCGADLATFLTISHDGPVAAAVVVLDRTSP